MLASTAAMLLPCCCTVLVCHQLHRPPWRCLACSTAQHIAAALQHMQLTLPVPAGPDHKYGPPVLVRVLRSIYLACAELCCYLLHRQAQQPAAQQQTATGAELVFGFLFCCFPLGTNCFATSSPAVSSLQELTLLVSLTHVPAARPAWLTASSLLLTHQSRSAAGTTQGRGGRLPRANYPTPAAAASSRPA